MSLDTLREEALARDRTDPFPGLRQEFCLPQHQGREQHYFCGNSLGLMPKAAAGMVQEVLDDWSQLAVEGHFKAQHSWMHYHILVRDALAHMVGAKPIEVVAMNTLSVNLHLMMVSFYRPSAERPAILIEAGAFPSDRHAVESQIRFHGFDPDTDLIELAADETNGTISMAAFERAFAEHGSRLALALLPGVQYRTGQALDIGAITALARKAGCAVGFDLAHSFGNIPLQLHQDGPDFAVWCHYKYGNAGPGAVAGCFVHERHARAELPRFAGWWGHEAGTRFLMGPQFIPAHGADGWQLSNPPVLALAPLRASVALFERAGMSTLRGKSERLTGFLEQAIQQHLDQVLDILTPAEPSRRGCQLSLRVRGGRDEGLALFEHLVANGVLGDWREPDVIRISPAPLYNSYADIAGFVESTAAWAARR